jgi:hypothetical protein
MCRRIGVGGKGHGAIRALPGRTAVDGGRPALDGSTRDRRREAATIWVGTALVLAFCAGLVWLGHSDDPPPYRRPYPYDPTYEPAPTYRPYLTDLPGLDYPVFTGTVPLPPPTLRIPLPSRPDPPVVILTKIL